MNMTRCRECGKKLRILEGYRHPALGKDHLVCSPCFDQVSESVEKWRNAVLPYVGFFKNKSLKKENESEKINILSSWLSIEKRFY
jgi:hypothetical protein